MSGSERPPLYPCSVFDLPVLTEALGSLGKNADHARTIQKHALKCLGKPWEEVSEGQDLPKAVIKMLKEDFVRTTSEVVERRESKDGTIKMMVRLQDGLEVETVVIPMSPGYSTICLSSQVGCAMGCTFCATGMLGLKGSLTAGEIIEQVVHARDACPTRNIRNVVFMGMGEPLMNYDAVLTSCCTLTDQKTFSMPSTSITVSTVGVVSAIRRLARDAPWIRLAFSLHSPVQEDRKKIIPSANKYPLTDIISAIEYFSEKSGSRVMIEYTVLEGTNASESHAEAVGELLQGKEVVVNLIPYNPTSVKEMYQVPSPEVVEAMWQVLVKKYKIKTTIRQQHGVDIGGACGQLAFQREGGTVLADMEAFANKPKAVKGSVGAKAKEQQQQQHHHHTKLNVHITMAMLSVLAAAMAWYLQSIQ